MAKVVRDFSKDINKIYLYREKLVDRIKQNKSIDTINEWLIDNYYTILENKRYIDSEFSGRKFYRISFKRKKAIKLLVLNILKEYNYGFNEKSIYDSILRYQKQNEDYFSYVEINYIFDIFRVILIEELDNLCGRLDNRLDIKDNLIETYNIILKNINKKGFKLDKYVVLNKDSIDNAYYIEELNYMLRKLGVISESIFVKLNELFNENNLSMKSVIKKAHSEYTSDSILISNIFSFLKQIDRVELSYFYENTSFVEKTLNSEKANVYPKMYENNKKEYRHFVTKNAKKQKISEFDYAKKIVEKADGNNNHLGFYLFKEKNLKARTNLYIGLILFFTFTLSFFISYYLGGFTFIFLIIPMSIVVIEIINQILMHTTRINTINKIKFEDGLPEKYASMIVIPTLLKDKKKVIDMFNNLEVYYLSNKTDNLYFALVGDASTEKSKDVKHDEIVMQVGLEKAKALNKKYGKELFYFIYRNRFYNDGEESFLGYERKRGALDHFNKVLLKKFNKTDREKWFKCDTFDGFNKNIKYVITLDADTKVVLGTALKLIGSMAHPMNKAILSEDKKIVISGYGIMQPKISIDIEVTNKSQYSQLFAGLGGLDIYTTASFEVYQDVFSEAIFAGKGIYDLEVFDTILGGTFPNNLILSHDMIEGLYLRCGLINDVELFDDYPSSYLKDASRHHRWNRGDWQTIAWFRKKVKNEKKEKIFNPISLLSKWKIFDDLRRSTIHFFLISLLFYGIIFGGETSIYYFILVLFVTSIPIFFYLLSKLFYRSRKNFFMKYYLTLIRGIFAMINKAIVILIVLPYEVSLYMDSTIKALYRMFISKKNLLNWLPAAEQEKKMNDKLFTYIKAFKVNYIAALLLLFCAYYFNQSALFSAYLIAGLWILAPIIMHLISKKPYANKPALNVDQKFEIKEIAHQTFKYFNEYLNEKSNFLIPDNYQYNRSERVDHRTSPTNIGFSLTAIISGFELEFISEKRAVYLLSNIIATLERLEKWNGHLYNWYDIYTLKKLPKYFVSTVDNGNYISALFVVKSFLSKHGYLALVKKINGLINEAHFSKLYNEKLDIFSIGYDYMEEKLIPYHYNNFASESRLASFVAIAKGDVPFKHWFCLDKTLTKFKNFKGIVSWGGTSFEYFMPLLFMKTYNHTLLDESYHFAHFAQKKFMRQVDKKLPWGMSESAYNELDDSQSYKYKTFGIPYLKFKEEPNYPIVISPYSSLMAISIDEQDVYNNILKLKDLGMYGKYGFYEAYDHDDKAIVKAYYAHHQGMSLVSLTNYLKDNVIRKYFHMNKEIDAVEILLKEKVQLDVYIDLKVAKYKKYNYNLEHDNYDIREFNDVNKYSEYSLLSNGFYSVLLDDSGRGFSKYKNLQINRYRKVTDQDYGLFLYIKNIENNKVWTNTYAPMNIKPDKYRTIFSSDKIKYIREDGGIVTTTEIVVPKDHTAEIRKITLKNNSNDIVNLEVTSFSELIMCRNEVDVSHRVFNSMTISSEIDKESNSLIFVRRSKTKEDTKYYVVNRMFVEKDNGDFSYETSRVNFIGRNKDLRTADAIFKDKELSNTIGVALDPIMSIRKKIILNPREKKELYIIVGFGKSMEQVKNIVKAYNDPDKISNTFDATAIYNHMIDSYSGITINQKRLYNKLLKYLYNKNYRVINREQELKKNNLSQETLWKFSVSGDLPIILIEIGNLEDAYFVYEVLKMYEFFKSKTIYLDVVIINSEEKGKEELVIKNIDKFLYRINNLNYFENTLGNIYNISNKDINETEKKTLRLLSVAVLDAGNKESLETQIDNLYETVDYDFTSENYVENVKPNIPKELEFYNEYGGFASYGREYVVSDINTPMPWINVLAGNKFGSIISSSMGGFTYAFNSNQYKISAWSNDITRDNISERLLINGYIFRPNLVRHGFGYTILVGETNEYNLFIKMFVSPTDKKKYIQIKVINKLKTKRKINFDLSIKGVLGVTEESSSKFIVSNFDEKNNMLILENKYNTVYKDVKVFTSCSLKIDRYDIKSYYKSIGTSINLDYNEEKVFTFTIGILEETESKKIDSEYEDTVKFWNDKLNVIQVVTPDKSFNYMINGWNLYQVYASRIMAKCGFYQVGGATGFRDQLQDVMSVLYSDPDLTRSQILEHAKHQFTDGGVLHWWHEDMMFGIRTTFSDDYLWLIYVTNEYLKITEDYDILNEEVCFIDGDKLDGKNEKGINYTYTAEKVSLYKHLKLCIDRAINRFGKHKLPLMGCGDWNDGMNSVGEEGKGESVFVGFFLYDLLGKMSKISERRVDSEFSKLCLKKQEELKTSLNNNAWDGNWYLRAFFDNGDPLGSRNNIECQIDLLSQSWSILSGVCDSDKKSSIYKAVESRLVDKENKIIKLLTPAFKESKNNPGYIRDYIPGIRENGGQYTHAALWYIMALLKDNKINKAYEYYQMINPINRTLQKVDVDKYKTEPYTIAADIYSNEKNEGRGGWSWYTGSASWAYTIAIEEILGFKKKGNTLTINPKINSSWDGFEITYKYLNTKYLIRVNNKDHVSSGKVETILDGKTIKDNIVELRDDKEEHIVIINLEERV